MGLILEFLLLGAFAATLVTAFMILKARIPNNTAYTNAVALALIAAFLLFSVNGAVGIIGSSNNHANIMFFGVLAIGFCGSLLARFRPTGMARSMFVTMVGQVLVVVIATMMSWGSATRIWSGGLWLGSGLLFLKAARVQQ